MDAVWNDPRKKQVEMVFYYTFLFAPRLQPRCA